MVCPGGEQSHLVPQKGDSVARVIDCFGLLSHFAARNVPKSDDGFVRSATVAQSHRLLAVRPEISEPNPAFMPFEALNLLSGLCVPHSGRIVLPSSQK